MIRLPRQPRLQERCTSRRSKCQASSLQRATKNAWSFATAQASDLPSRKAPPPPEVKAAIENIYFDTAASALLYDEDCIARVVDLVGESRVLFGSDYPLLSPRRQIQRVQALLPGGSAQAVCGGNADTLLWEHNNP